MVPHRGQPSNDVDKGVTWLSTGCKFEQAIQTRSELKGEGLKDIENIQNVTYECPLYFKVYAGVIYEGSLNEYRLECG